MWAELIFGLVLAFCVAVYMSIRYDQYMKIRDIENKLREKYNLYNNWKVFDYDVMSDKFNDKHITFIFINEKKRKEYLFEVIKYKDGNLKIQKKGVW
jgi:hypothetical protein